ncbi:hypothetical protein CYLTODRAFT_493164 [Cylindrobasidium torrendii FP15055 ss-10]|uniref:Autophagy-related protein 14 n=1 Tax=Cylindrobasidium torrendii FP15055 ss-10 TaxID=1314674 RepID=A0A0D7B2F9_9AGAR|nr:hypothetical protein CYLTODRAFT_493164 [Cylindrobasidium torrendii FP15055 ss-10]
MPPDNRTAMSDNGLEEQSFEQSFEYISDLLPEYTHRRIRHISSVQVRNLTPFPERDTLAHALSHSAEQIQFTANGHHADDLDISMSMKRSRRISLNSVNTMRSIRSDEANAAGDGLQSAAEQSVRGRARAASRTSITHRTPPTAPTIRGNRNRTMSNASSLFGKGIASLPSSASALPAFYQVHTQAGLEKVIQTRLVESFLSITVHHDPEASLPSTPLSPRSLHPPSSPSTPAPSANKSRLNGVHAKSHKPVSRSEDQRIPDVPSRPLFNRSQSTTHARAPSTPTPPPRTPVKPSFSSPSTSAQSTDSSIPDFLSPIHPPSTNPSFTIDASADFAPGTNTTGQDVTVALWAKLPPSTTNKGKGREDSAGSWTVLTEWSFSLSELVPLSEDLQAHSSQLPPNTLVVHLDPPGRPYALLPSRQKTRSRSRSPEGYASDPESGRVKHVKDLFTDPPASPLPRRRHRRAPRRESHSPEPDYVYTASWQDLFNLVTLQRCIQEAQSSLDFVIHRIDTSVLEDVGGRLMREVGEREVVVGHFRKEVEALRGRCDERMADIANRRAQLKQRRDVLRQAKEHLQEDGARLEALESSQREERVRVDELKTSLAPTRSALLSVLASLFPIEMREAGELLFTIVDVPLPIPVAATDPAPPLSVVGQRDVNEESVATALGYAAQLVQMAAGYLGKGLVYPITYVGSRSLIRDGISAMVGPRMFPLFPKGVDTYRFEYGVFLLNKDIELLMADHDLRALDMRHTLANLKNLLLTVTNGAEPPRGFGSGLGTGRRLGQMENLSESSLGLESVREGSPVEGEDDPATPKPAHAEFRGGPDNGNGNGAGEGDGQTTGATTPTGLTKRTFMPTFNTLSSGLGFLSLRRYGKSTVNLGDGNGAADDGDLVEDDRRTLRGEDTGREDTEPAHTENGPGREKVPSASEPANATTVLS